MPLQRLRKQLEAGRWFKALPPEFQAQLLAAGTVQRLSAGERLFARGDPPSGLFAMLEGTMRISAPSEEGKEALLTLAEPPTWFGEISVFDGQPRTHDAVAAGEVELFFVPQAALDRLLAEHPQRWRELGLLLATKLRLTFTVLEEAALLPISVRLARRLVWIALGYGEWHDRQARVIEVSQEQLSSMLSTSRQTVNQVLKALEAKGVLRIAYGSLEIVDLGALRAAAGL